MTIDPEGKLKGLSCKWEVAAVDLPVPGDLTDRRDIGEWKAYLDNLSPAQQLRKLGQALDEYHALAEKAPDAMALPASGQVALFSKWEAASIAAIAVAQRLQFAVEGAYSDRKFGSDIDLELYYVTDFLKNVNSPDTKLWEDRRARHDAVQPKNFNQFLNFMMRRGPSTGERGPQPS